MRTRQRQTAADILAFRAEVERLRGQLSLTAPRRAEAAVCPCADSARANTAALHAPQLKPGQTFADYVGEHTEHDENA